MTGGLSSGTPITVHGLPFAFTGLAWDSRAMHHAPRYVCRDIEAELVSLCGGDWSCRIHGTGGTGDSAEAAFVAAYRALDARVDRLTQTLNRIYEMTGIAT
jgi:hypothetical protein